MKKVTLRSIWEHKRRLVSTVLAIVLGVAFMSGTFVFADTIDKVFDDLFSDVNEEVDVQVQGVTLFDGGFGGGDARQELDIAVADTVAAVDGVERVAPFVQTLGFGATNRVIGPDGEVLGSSQGPPTLLESWIDDEVLNPYSIAEGTPPTADDELTLNVGAADDAGIELGDTVTVLTQFGESEYTVVGTFLFGEAESAAGAVSVDFTLAEAQRIAGLDGKAQVVLAAGDGSISDEELSERVEAALPEGAEAITGEEAAEQTAAGVQEGFSFFRQILTIFGAIALLVGTFIISNTFSILVAQRTRELALLRAIGATRRQVLSSVMLEAGVIGILAAVLGLVGGIALAIAVTAGLSASGADLPTSGLVISPQTVVIAFVIGLGVTLLASLLPAVQATRVPPLAALREVSVDRSGASKPRIVVGVLVLAFGAWNLSAAWRSGDSDSIPVVGTGALALIVGAIVVGPVLAEPTVRILGGWIPKLKGVTGRLATENAARSPKRTSATASALLIGVALIGFITIFGESAQVSVASEVERGFTGDLIVQGDQGFGPPAGFPPTVADDVAAVDGVDSITRVGFTQGQLSYDDGDTATDFVFALDPESADVSFSPRMSEGEITDLAPGGIVVDVGVADNHDLVIGDMVTITGTGGQMQELRVDAISDDFTLLGNFTVSFETYGEIVSEQQLVQVVVVADDGVDVAALQTDLDAVVEDLPSVNVLDRDEFIGDLASQITSFLTLVNALLFLSIIIAMIGIDIGLSLSIHERTRELGLLRAVGMSRSQLRSAVRWEAVIISLLGTLVGLGVGLITSWALVTSLGTFGLNTFSIPVVSLAIVVILAAALGVLASIRPARRAAKLNILDAIATD